VGAHSPRLDRHHALINRNDTWHGSASEWARRVQEPLVTTDAVRTEVADALCRSNVRQWAVTTLENVKTDPAITSIEGGRALFRRAFDLYRGRVDKDWSLTDCISFVVMKDRRLDRALTSDVRFVQAGFRALLRE
jgi:predicted nucleic acid-binding protein